MSDTAIVSPFPTVGHLYLLVAGILLGILLGPAVLGRAAPATYNAWFLGGGEDAATLRREEAAVEAQLNVLRGVAGVTEVAEQALVQREAQRIAPLKLRVPTAEEARERAVRGWLGALVAAVVLICMAEALVSPDVRGGGSVRLPRALGGLITARYALLALWIAIGLARPDLLLDLPWLLVALLVGVAAASALVPLGRR